MRRVIPAALMLALIGAWGFTTSTQADDRNAFQLLGPVVRQESAGNTPAVVATPVRWGRNVFGGRSYDGRPNSGQSQSMRDFYRGYYGSRPFNYGGTYARPGYAPGPL